MTLFNNTYTNRSQILKYFFICSILLGSFLLVKSASAHPFISNYGTLLDGFENVSDWAVTGTGATAENETSIFREGNQSIKLNATGGNNAYLTKTVSLDLSSGDGISFWFYATDITKLSYVVLDISSITTIWTQRFKLEITGGRLEIDGWNYVQLSKSDFVNVGGESWDNTMVRIRFFIIPMTGEDASVNFDDFRFGIVGQPKVIMSFDDGCEGQITKAYPIMAANNQKGVTFAHVTGIGGDNRLTLVDLQTLQSAGWDISNHGYAHTNLVTASQEDMEANIDGGYNWLVANGFGNTAKFFAYPFNAWNDAVITKLKEKHVLARAGSTSDFGMHFDIINFEDLQYKLGSYGAGGTPPIAVSTVQTHIDSIIAKSGLAMIYFHNIVDSDATGNDYLTADFQTISDYLAAKQDAKLLEVITFSDYYNALRPYTIGTNNIDIGAGATIYADGRFINTGTASGSTASLSITPTGGFDTSDCSQWMTVAITDWLNTGTYYKKWTESATGTLSVAHTVGDLKANTYYTVKVDGTRYDTYLSDDTGTISFTYTGVYSDHEFEVEEDTAPSASFDLSSPYDNTSTHDTTPTFSWNASTDSESGLAKYQLYINGNLDRDDISSSTTSAIPSQSLSCESHTWYIKAVDNAGNAIQSNSTFTVNIVCGFTPGQPISEKPISTMTVAEIRAKITEITEAIFQLKLLLSEAEKTKKTYEGIPSDFTFDKNLEYGQISEEVEFLQIILKQEIGPPTYPENVPATGWFGPITKSSVVEFQGKYASDILTPWNLTKGTGFVGRTTRVKLNELLNR